MNQPLQPARPDQVELLTRGVQLPLDALADAHLFVILEALASAWNDLVRNQSIVDTHEEPEITALIESWLNNTSTNNDRRWHQLGMQAVRGKETINFDGRQLEVKPDLSILLNNPMRGPFPVVVECKKIDKSTNRRVRLYGTEGLVRFVQGRYAWYAREAIMCAYVRDGSTITTCLTPYLKNHMHDDRHGYCTLELPVPVPRGTHDLARSKHRRNYRYLETSEGQEPGPITLWHLWMTSVDGHRDP